MILQRRSKRRNGLGTGLFKPEVVEVAVVRVGMMACAVHVPSESPVPIHGLLSYSLAMGSSVHVQHEPTPAFPPTRKRKKIPLFDKVVAPSVGHPQTDMRVISYDVSGINKYHIANIPLYRESWVSLSSTLSAFTITSEFKTFWVNLTF